MVIATSAFRLGMEGKRFALENIGFQNPLVLRPSNDDKAWTPTRGAGVLTHGRFATKVNPELNPGVDLYLQIQEPEA